MRDAPMPKSYKLTSKPHHFCPGCGHPIVLRILGELIDELKIARQSLIALDIGCALLAWDYFDVDTLQTHHGRTMPVIAGFKIASHETVAIGYMGDGGAYAIGLQSLLHSAHRNDAVTTIVVNNTLYAMTGGQLAPTTLASQITDSTPAGRDITKTGEPLLGPEIVASVANKYAYVARGRIDQQPVLKQYIKKALENQMKHKSFGFVESLSVCPLNWKTDAHETLAELETMAKYYPCGEIKVPSKLQEKK